MNRLPASGKMGVAYVLPPHDAAGAAIHHEVSPLVNKGDIVEWCLRKEGGQREHPDECDADQRAGVAAYKMIYFLGHFFQF